VDLHKLQDPRQPQAFHSIYFTIVNSNHTKKAFCVYLDGFIQMRTREKKNFSLWCFERWHNLDFELRVWGKWSQNILIGCLRCLLLVSCFKYLSFLCGMRWQWKKEKKEKRKIICFRQKVTLKPPQESSYFACVKHEKLISCSSLIFMCDTRASTESMSCQYCFRL
jgi:hypothetical protein